MVTEIGDVAEDGTRVIDHYQEARSGGHALVAEGRAGRVRQPLNAVGQYGSAATFAPSKRNLPARDG